MNIWHWWWPNVRAVLRSYCVRASWSLCYTMQWHYSLISVLFLCQDSTGYRGTGISVKYEYWCLLGRQELAETWVLFLVPQWSAQIDIFLLSENIFVSRIIVCQPNESLYVSGGFRGQPLGKSREFPMACEKPRLSKLCFRGIWRALWTMNIPLVLASYSPLVTVKTPAQGLPDNWQMSCQRQQYRRDIWDKLCPWDRRMDSVNPGTHCLYTIQGTVCKQDSNASHREIRSSNAAWQWVWENSAHGIGTADISVTCVGRLSFV